MLTYITGDFLITQIAEAMARGFLKQGNTVKIFFSGAIKTEIIAAAEDHSQVIVCWQNCTPMMWPDPDVLIKSVHPMTILKQPANMTDLLGEYTHVCTISVPPSQFNQPPRNISLIDGDGEYIDYQHLIKDAA